MVAAPPQELNNMTLKNHCTVRIKCLLAEFEYFFWLFAASAFESIAPDAPRAFRSVQAEMQK